MRDEELFIKIFYVMRIFNFYNITNKNVKSHCVRHVKMDILDKHQPEEKEREGERELTII